jgi:hypothetical protein
LRVIADLGDAALTAKADCCNTEPKQKKKQKQKQTKGNGNGTTQALVRLFISPENIVHGLLHAVPKKHLSHCPKAGESPSTLTGVSTEWAKPKIHLPVFCRIFDVT